MFSPGRSRSPRSKCTAQKSVSFKMYELEQKIKLKASYPFLSADQIKSRIKDQWHNLAQDEKNKYTKVRLKSTPVKDKQKSNKYQKSYGYSRKRKTNSNVTAMKKQKLEVCPTPEFVNMEKLQDFRTKHTESYDNDFSDSPASQENQTESSLRGWMKAGMVTYEKAGFNVVRHTPEVIDNNPCQQAGILKTREKAEQPAVTKGRVSFSSPTDVYQLSDVYSDNFSDNDNDGLLIKRNEYNASPLLIEPGTGYSSDSDDNDAALLITRQEEDCETTDMATTEPGQGTNQDSNDKKDSEVNSNETSQIQSGVDQPKPTVTKRKRSGAKQGRWDENSPKNKFAKKSDTTEADELAYQEKEQMELEKDLEADKFETGFIDKRSDSNEEQFKSPLPDAGKTRLRRGRKRKQEDARSAEITTPVGTASRLSQLVTPTGAQNVDTVNNYTTPQMDEDLQHETLEAVVKAPQKRRQSAPSTTDLEKLRVLTAGRRVTRSLIAAKDIGEKKSPELLSSLHSDKANSVEKRRNEVQNNLYQLENACNLMDPSGDARSSTVNKQGKSNHRTENKEVSMSIDASDGDKHIRVVAADKNFEIRSDMPKQLTCALEVDKNLVAAVSKTETRNPNLKYEDMFCHRAVGHQKNGSRCLSEESSDESQNSEASSASPATTLSVNTNPVLEKALRNLRCTSSDSPKILSEKPSTRSSPALLSPALSGVSELSSASSSSLLMDQYIDQGDSTCPTESQDKKPTQQSLCQMFKDLTPPDHKTAGPYKTQRLVSSSATESKNFKQLFQSEEESLFF